MSFNFIPLTIADVVLIEPQVFTDKRGFFTEVYKQTEFAKHGINQPFIQVNHSQSKKGILRGLHYQLEHMAQGKLIRTIVGEIFDVAVDIRKGSPTFGKWVGETLSAENRKMLYVPPGFAHGFCVLSKVAEIIYYCTQEYSLEHERGIIWSDPKLNIEWPVWSPTVSKKDAALPMLDAAELK